MKPPKDMTDEELGRCRFCGERDGKHAWIGGDPCYLDRRRGDSGTPSGIQIAIRDARRAAAAQERGE